MNSDRFVAIDVGAGDAFFLERPDFSVLVDGGRSVRQLPRLFQGATGAAATEIAACTHNDSDHSRGIIGLLEHALCSKEVWLPASWLAALRAMVNALSMGNKLEDELSTEELENFWESIKAKGVADEAGRFESIEEVASRISRWRGWIESVPCGETAAEEGWPKDCLPALEERLTSDSYLTEALRRCAPEPKKGPVPTALEAARRIGKIAVLTRRHHLRVRWFDHSPRAPSGGNPGRLEPLNAKEVSNCYYNGPVLVALLLTIANRESLAFYAPAAGSDGGPVLFLADSDLRGSEWFLRSLPLRGVLATAPHHGSENNVDAYNSVSRLTNAGAQLWVRSDGAYSARPAAWWIKSGHPRFCTLCRTSPVPAWTRKHALHFSGMSGIWHSPSPQCQCR